MRDRRVLASCFLSGLTRYLHERMGALNVIYNCRRLCAKVDSFGILSNSLKFENTGPGESRNVDNGQHGIQKSQYECPMAVGMGRWHCRQHVQIHEEMYSVLKRPLLPKMGTGYISPYPFFNIIRIGNREDCVKRNRLTQITPPPLRYPRWAIASYIL